MPVLGQLLEMMGNHVDLDMWGESLLEAIECVVGIINCTHLSIFTLDRCGCAVGFRTVMRSLLTVLLSSMTTVRQYPKI